VQKNKGKLQEIPDKGSLPGHMKEPKVVSDPNHRRKQLTKELYELSKKTVKDRLTMTGMDVKRLGKNYGYRARALPKMKETDYCAAATAVLEHHFDNHQHCGDWCKRRLLSAEAKNSKRFYRCKKKDAMLYKHLSDIVAKYTTSTLETLKEIAHGVDTNANESINNTISYFAPKNRVYCATVLLHNRVAMATGIISLGFHDYFQRLLKTLGITITDNVTHDLKYGKKRRQYRLNQATKSNTKKLRTRWKYEVLKLDEQKAIRQRDKREDTYQSGGNLLPGGFDGIEEDNRKRPARKTTTTKNCPHCGLKGHVTTKSKYCLKSPKNVNQTPTKSMNIVETTIESASNTEPDVEPSDDIDAYDSVPFDAELPSMNVEQDEFHDCGTWSEDEDGIIHETAPL
jgi:hypothetical protein